MNAKKLWAYLIVLLIVAGVFILSEYVFMKKTREKENGPLMKVAPGSITEIRWQRGEEVLELKKNKTWEIVQPLKAAADPLALEGVVQGLSNLRAERSFEPAGKDLTEYGLNPPQTIIRFAGQEGQAREIKMGSQAAVGNARYFQVAGATTVYLAEGLSLKELDRDLLALREKKVFSLAPEQVEKVEIRAGKNILELEKTGKGWHEKEVPDRFLDKARVDAFIHDLTWVKARAFLDGEKESPAWGLQVPGIRVRLTGGGGKIEETLTLGAEAPEKGLYARSSRFAAVLVLEGGLAAKIPTDLNGWEEKAPLGGQAPKEIPKESKKGT